MSSGSFLLVSGTQPSATIKGFHTTLMQKGKLSKLWHRTKSLYKKRKLCVANKAAEESRGPSSCRLWFQPFKLPPPDVKSCLIWGMTSAVYIIWSQVFFPDRHANSHANIRARDGRTHPDNQRRGSNFKKTCFSKTFSFTLMFNYFLNPFLSTVEVGKLHLEARLTQSEQRETSRPCWQLLNDNTTINRLLLRLQKYVFCFLDFDWRAPASANTDFAFKWVLFFVRSCVQEIIFSIFISLLYTTAVL